MHSSRMRTGRSLTVFRSLLIPGGGAGGVPPWSQGVGICLVLGRVSAWSCWGYLPGPGGTCLVPGGCTCLVLGEYVSGPGECTCLVLGGVYLVRGTCTCLVPEGVPAWSREGGTCLVPG